MIPNSFFHHLQTRFSIGNRQRLPNTAKMYLSGTHQSKKTYKFVNPKLVGHIFSTMKMPLTFERRFSKNDDGAFVPLEAYDIIAMNAMNAMNGGYPPIRPTEYRTYLKIGPSTLHKYNRGTFEVTWTENLLPKSGYGEMTIKFELGIMKNNEIIHKKDAIFD